MLKNVRSYLAGIIPVCTLLTIFLSFSNTSSAQSSRHAKELLSGRQWGFEENAGQVADEQGRLHPEVLYTARNGNKSVFFMRDRVVFQHTVALHRNSPMAESGAMMNSAETFFENVPVAVSRMEMVFTKEANATAVASRPMMQKNNYYLPHCGDGITDVRSFATLTYKNVYKGIDLVFYAAAEGLKYEYIVHPGADPDEIEMQWHGLRSLQKNKDGGLEYAYTAGKLEESAPVCFTENGAAVRGSFVAEGSRVRFRTGRYDRKETLVIDPLLRWSTYYGGENSEHISNMDLDSRENVYIAGATMSTMYIASSTAFQDTLYNAFVKDANTDGIIAKFDNKGRRVWSTYFGGAHVDVINGIALSGDTRLIIGGRTQSAIGISTAGSYQETNNGGGPYNIEGFMGAFDTSGKREWTSYFGGKYADAIMGVAADDNYFYITGWTKSDSSIATTGSFKPGYGGGDAGNHNPGGDAFIAKFTTGGALRWSTYYGGLGDEQGTGISLNGQHIAISGYTFSLTHIATSGAWQEDKYPNSQFFADAFVAAFDTAGSRQWATYLGGEATDYLDAIQVNAAGDIFTTGYSNSKNNIATSNAYETTGTGSDGLIAKFNANGTPSWITYYGKGSDFRDIALDAKNNIYLAGITGSNGGQATTDAHQDSSGGTIDALVMIMDSAANRIYASYYGGFSSDFAYAIHPTSGLNFYFSGVASSYDNISLLGSYQDQLQGSFDGFLVYFDSIGHCAEMPAPLIAGSTTACGLETVVYGTAYYENHNYEWTVTGGTILYGQSADSVAVRWDRNGGAGSLKVVATNYNNCVKTDEMNVTVHPAPTASFAPPADGCVGEGIAFSNSGTADSYEWNFADGSTSTDVNPVHTFAAPGMYKVYVKAINSTGCVDSAYQFVVVSPLPEAGWQATVLTDSSLNFEAQDTTFAHYSWDFGDGSAADTMHHTQHTYTQSGNYKVTLSVTSADGCEQSHDSTITIDLPSGMDDVLANGYYFKAYPNPFRDYTTIDYRLNSSAYVSLKVYDATGREVAVLMDRKLGSGSYHTVFDSRAHACTRGIYLLRLQVGERVAEKRLIKIE